MDGVINFSDFFKKSGKRLPDFNKEELLNDFFTEEEVQEEVWSNAESKVESVEPQEIEKEETELQSVETKSDSRVDPSVDKEEIEKLIQKEFERLKFETIKESQKVEQYVEIPIQEEIEPVYEDSSDTYKVYNDKSETFSCDIELEGANLKDTEVRLILESDNWNLMFPGEIDSSGKVTIPIRKLNLFEEGTKGKIKMEVIAEGTVFTPWEDTFEVKMSKKVMVKFNESKVQKPKVTSTPQVKVNLKK
jgi:hypothetical protein